MMYQSYIFMIDGLTARIKAVSIKLQHLKIEEFGRTDMQEALNQIESILNTMDKYNRTVRPLLRNLIFFFRTGLCSFFVVYSLDIDAFMRTLILIPTSSVSLSLILTAFYVSRTKSYLLDLYVSLNNRYVTSVSRSSMPLKLKIQARLLIKELGNDDKDGHFVMGFADGNGPKISPMEITNLVLETVFNSMMFLNIVS